MKRNSVIALITDPSKNFLLFFFVGVLLFSIIANGVADLAWELFDQQVTARLGWSAYWLRLLAVVVLCSLVLGVIYITNFSRWLRRSLGRFSLLGVEVPSSTRVEPLVATFDGLITPMSPRADSAAEAAIRHHWQQGQGRLRHCWLICTNRSIDSAREMVKRLTDEGVTEQVTIHYGQGYQVTALDPDLGAKLSLLVPDGQLDDPVYIQGLVDSLYAQAAQVHNLEDGEIIADYTGATKGMTAGILLACATPRRHLQYLSQVSQQWMAIRVAYRVKQLAQPDL
jgi:hypothetical protein